MLGARLHSPPLVPGQQPINGGVGHSTAHRGLVAHFDPTRREPTARLELLAATVPAPLVPVPPSGSDGVTRLWAVLEIVRPHPPDMAHAQADGLGDDCGGKIFSGPQPKT